MHLVIFRNKLTPALIFAFLLIACFGVYSSGLQGPFVFDDSENIENNSLLRITELNQESITNAALSGRAGPLKRPVAMTSFALNYYFSNSLKPFYFKLTNVAIQAICAWLLYVFCSQLLHLPITKNTYKTNSTIPAIAFCIAMLWAIHPINVTSVLYVVQRMTSLSTLFTLVTLILYIKARTNASNRNLSKYVFYITSFLGFLLAIFSKENALLIPAYLLLIEWVFFSKQAPWIFFKKLPVKIQKLLWLVLILTCTTLFLYTLNYASNGYNTRSFTLIERALTETRVICFYLSLIVLPRINAFGIFHDDIPLSTSLTDPWSTLLSIAVIIFLIALAIRFKKSNPLFSFGVLFFFTAHLLESTIFGLEIAHEHRNHLASMGIIIALTGLVIHHDFLSKKAIILANCCLFIILSITTLVRANHWQSEYDLAAVGIAHHPNSAATQGLLSNAAYARKEYHLAEKSINKARILEPNESAYAINSLVLASLLGKPVDANLEKEIRSKLKNHPFTASTQVALAHISTNLNNKRFKPLQPHFINWLNIILKKLGDTRQASIYHYFLAKAYLATGNNIGAINAHQQAFNLDKKFINPLFEMGNIFLGLKQPDNARVVLAQIEKANKNPELNRHYDIHIQELKDAINKIDGQKNHQPV